MWFKHKKAVAIIQARMGSERFSGKVLREINGKPALQIIIERLLRCRYLDDVIVATTTNHQDFPIAQLCERLDVIHSRGSEENVIKRVLDAATAMEADYIVDITGDCPLIDPVHVDTLVKAAKRKNYDYASNIVPRLWPDGFDVQVYRRDLLEQAMFLISDPRHYSHAGWNIINQAAYITVLNNGFSIYSLPTPGRKDYSWMEVTLDTPEDLEVIDEIFWKKADGSAMDVIRFIEAHPALLKKNENVKRKIPGEG